MTKKAFIGYSHKNQKFKDALRTHLAVLKQRGKVRDWHDNEILSGDKWRHEISKNLEEADIFLYLVCPHSLASENCNAELMQALKNNQKTRIVLIILDHCDWQHTELEQLQALPNGADGVVPIIDWRPQSKGWKNVTDGIWKLIDADDSGPDTEPESGQGKDSVAFALFSQGNFLNMAGQTQNAIEKYSQAVKINSELAGAYNNMGDAKNDLGKYEEAIADYNKAIAINPQDAAAYNNRGVSKRDSGKPEEAIADYNKAIGINSQIAAAYSNRGIAKYDLGNYEDAIADYNKAIAINPQYAIAYNNSAVSKRCLKQPKEAIADCNEAIRLNPQYADAYYNRGNAKYDLGMYEEAIADYSKAISINPKHAKAYNNRGVAYGKIWEKEKACADFIKANSLNPEFEIPEECKPKS